MFRGRQANPCSNKFLYMKQVEQRQKLHRERLKSMKPAIDNKAPKKPSHLTNNKKREQMMEDKFIQIERENRLLLQKMSHIMSKKSLDNTNESLKHATKSLNKSFRKRELQRITAENQNILRRIQQREPYYNHNEWEEERRVHEQYMRNICEYPLGKGKGKRKHGKAGKKRGGMGQSRSGLIPSLDSEYQRQSREKLNSSLNNSSSFSELGPSSNNETNAMPTLDPLTY